MGSIHCFTTRRKQRDDHVEEKVTQGPAGLPVLEGVIRDFRQLTTGPCTDAEVLRWSAEAVIRYLMELMPANNLDVDPKAQFRFFGVFHEGWYQLLFRVNKVFDHATGKMAARFFAASALDLYPKPVRMDSEMVKNNVGEPLITIPMSTLYRYTV
jgi:hypothetical protein